MYTETAGLYDRIYGKLKDYAAEAQQIAALIREAQPRARTILDVACGTGEHARQLAELGFGVDGIDLDPAFVAIAQAKLPGRRFALADMASFALGTTYDAVVCLFSAIGYVVTVPRLHEAIACMRRHVAPGGVLLVEPFYTRAQFTPGFKSSVEIDAGELHITRRSESQLVGETCRMWFEYDLTGPDGTRQVSEVHELGLFSVDDMQGAFAAAGLTASFDPTGGPAQRGLYLARG